MSDFGVAMLTTLRNVLQFLVLSGLAFSSTRALAQISVQNPSPAKIKSCDDFATQQFADPWDMSNTADINNFFPKLDVIDFTGAGFANGLFQGLTTGENSTLYLFSPVVIGSHAAGGRYGESLNLDPTKFTHLSVRMRNDKVDPHGMGVMFDRGRNYAAQRTLTADDSIPTKSGWHTYTVDLANSSVVGSDVRPWTAGSITGLALRPTKQKDATIFIDWIRLEDPSSCSSASSSISYTANASGGNNYFNLYLDDDQNPFNGYVKQLVADQAASGAGTATLSSPLGIAPGSYNAVGLLSSDYATLNKTNPWDFSDASDVLIQGGIENARFEGGSFKGKTQSSPAIHLSMGGNFEASRYHKLSVKITRSGGNGNFTLFFAKENGGGGALITSAHHVGNDVYNFDLSGAQGWSGTIKSLILVPADASGIDFSLDWVSLRSSGYVTSLSAEELAASTAKSSQPLVINAPPLAQLDEPNDKGGVALKSWNMNAGDFVNYANLTNAPDPAHPGESLTTFLPDSRLVDGLRGDFYKGTNRAPSDDPVQYSTFPYTPNELNFNADEYRNLCFKMLIDVPFILTDLDGSMARVVWKEAGSELYESSGAFVAIYDGWSGTKWYEYCDDMKTLESEAMVNGSTWGGEISEFRLDAHEIRFTAPYYYDYIKLRKDDTSVNGKFVIPFTLTDADDSATVSLYYNSSKSTTGGTLIVSGLAKTLRHYTWDTSSVPDGTYYVYSVASDSLNTVRKLASGRLVVKNSGSANVNAPVLSVLSPQDGDVVCSALQVKGYALQADRLEDVASVEVAVDGSVVDMLHPSLFSPAAKSEYTNADSNNSGFERSYAFDYAAGAHTITITARSTDGGITTKSVSVTKGNSSCTAPRVDADPAGSPVTVDTGVAPVEPTPTPHPRTLTPPKVSGSISRTGVFQVAVSGLADSGNGCTFALYLGAKKGSATLLTKTLAISSAASQKGMKLKATGIRVNPRKLKAIFARGVKSCGSDTSTSGVVGIKIGTGSGTINSISQLKSQLAKKLK